MTAAWRIVQPLDTKGSVAMFTIKRTDQGEWEQVEVLFNYWGCAACLLFALVVVGVVALVLTA